jgi:hypothetical protein
MYYTAAWAGLIYTRVWKIVVGGDVGST